MKNLIDYQIPFKGLKEGIHHYDFKVEDEFFEHFEYAEIKQSMLEVKLVLDRQSTLMVLDFSIQGTVHVECSRCLDDLVVNLNSNDKLVIKFGEEIPDGRYVGEEVQVVSSQENEINVAQFIYEMITLDLPLKRVHPDDEEGFSTCNREMLEKLEGYSVHEDEEKTDPRWDQLKDLLNN